MPGIETRAPDLTDSKSGLFKFPNFLKSISFVWGYFFGKLVETVSNRFTRRNLLWYLLPD